VLAALKANVVSSPPSLVRIVQPLLLRPETATVHAVSTEALSSPYPGVAAASSQYGPVLVRVSWGRGSIWLTTVSDFFTNAGIALGDNRRAALNFAGPARSTVIFLEGAGSTAAPASSSGWLTSTVWGVALLLLLAIVVLYRGTSGRRLGPAANAPHTHFRPAVQYVLSMASLLRQAGKSADVWDMYARAISRDVQRRHGGPEGLAGMEREHVERLLTPISHLSEDELVERARAAVALMDREGRHT
jgi:hypothetical protein